MKTRTRVILTTVAALLLLGAAIGAGLNAVFTVTNVSAQFTTCSEQGDADAAVLKQKLDAFVGKSTTFLDLDDVRAVVAEYPHFRVEEAKKEMPSTVRLTVSERKETFALPRSDGKFDILDEEGLFITTSEENVNRAKGENILLTGDFRLSVSEDGTVSGKYYPEFLTVISAFADALKEVRANVVSVALDSPTSDGLNDSFVCVMREGVVVIIRDPLRQAAEKADMVIARYLSLKDEERIYGYLSVTELDGGELRCDYMREDYLH